MDIEKSRFNMIEQQIRPWDVLDTDVLDLLSVVKREHYVPEAYRALAFVDMEIPLAGGQNMLAPRVEARVLQELAVRKHEDVLEVGAGSGYMAALLAHRGRQVTTLDIVPELVAFARDNLSRNGVTNVDVVEASGAQGWGDGLYDVICVSALEGWGIEELRQTIADRLHEGAETRRIDVPAADGTRLAWLHARGQVLDQALDGDVMHLSVKLSPENWARYDAL